MAFEKVVIRDCVLYRGSCYEILPTLFHKKGEHDEHAASRKQKENDACAEVMGFTEGSHRTSLFREGHVATKSRELFSGITGGHAEGHENVRHQVKVQGEPWEEEWKIQGWFAKSPISKNDNEGQMPELRIKRETGDTSQKRRPLRQPIGQSRSSLYALPHERNSQQMVESEEGWLANSEIKRPSGMEKIVILTDPPTGVFSAGGGWGKWHDLQWDKEPAKNIAQIISLGDEAIVWGGNYFQLPPSRGWLVWHKRDRVQSAADVELAWTSLDMNSRMIDHTIAATNLERCGHPTQKPIRVMQWSLSFLQPGLTLDPFMGSGTTGVCCVKLQRPFIGIEIEPRYFDMACNRIENAYRDHALLDLMERVPDTKMEVVA